MIWLNGLLAVPTIGIRIKPHYGDMQVFENQIAKFIDYISKNFDELKIDKLGSWGYKIEPKESGYRFHIEPHNIVAHFSYAVVQKPIAGGFPTFKIPKLQSFQELQSILVKYIKAILELFDSLTDFSYDRIGLIADMTLEKDSIPPGIINWLEDLSKTIKGDIIMMDSTFLVELNNSDKYNEKCFHYAKYDNTKPEIGYEIKLDWQREFHDKMKLNSKKMYTVLDDCITSSLEYFKNFGEGV